jgi:3-deoxy-D-manno-octulosonic-acid transferase
LEPAVWGKPVFYGPSMEDFPDARALLETHGAGETVTGSEMLAERVIHLLRTPVELEARGRRARDAVLGHGRAAERHARVVADLLDAAREPYRLNREVG